MANKSSNKLIWSLKTGHMIWFLSTLTMVSLIALFLVSEKHWKVSAGWEGVLSVTAESFFGVSLTILIIGIIYEKWTKENFILEMKKSIADTILFDEENISHHSLDRKKQAIGSYIKSILGEDKGTVLFKEIISPYLESDQGFRKDFEYNVLFEDNISEKFKNKLNFKSTEYYFVHEYLEYTKEFCNEESDSIKIGFSTNSFLLNNWFPDGKIFFREWLDVEQKEQEGIEKLNLEDRKDFIENFLNLKVSFTFFSDGNPVVVNNYKLIESEPGGLVVEISNDDLPNIPYSSYTASIEFRMPQRKKAKKFLITISEATYAPKITFRYTPSMEPVSDLPFFPYTSCDLQRTIGRRRYSYDLNFESWVFPKSGIVFTWE